MTKHDQERRDALLKYIAKVELQITKDYGQTCKLIGKIQELRTAIESNEDFAWEKHPEVRNKVRALLDRFANKTSRRLTAAVSTAYDIGLTDANQAVLEQLPSSLSKSKTKSAEEIAAESLASHRKGGKEAHTYATAMRGGMTLSDRVWALTDNTEKEIEICVQNTLLSGGNAGDLSREIRGYLNNPKALFRRVRNPKTGLLELSKAAQNYHPGQGVYRSAYMNAMRLTRTEINMAYRTAETASFADNPLVTGYRIRTSNNHTTLYKGKRIPLVDICDRLAGEYPATFKWNGWHPQCRCIIVPGVLSEDDLDKLIDARSKAIKEDRDPKNVLPGLGRNPELPADFVNWYEENEDRIKAAKYRPIWVGASTTRQVNKQLAGTDKPTPQPVATPMPTPQPTQTAEPKEQPKQAEPRTRDEILAAAKARHEARTADEIRDIQDRADVRAYGQEYVDGIHELEKALGMKRGKRMTNEEADKQNANPKHTPLWIKDKDGRWTKNPDYDEKYSINCATCSPTYELRRRGFPITAGGNSGKADSINYKISLGKSFEAWKNADGSACEPTLLGKWMKEKGYDKMTPKRYGEYYEEFTKEDGVYVITVSWKGGNGAHATILQRIKGKLYRVEPQEYDEDKGALMTIDELCKDGAAYPYRNKGIMRVDNKIFKTEWAGLFVKK